MYLSRITKKIRFVANYLPQKRVCAFGAILLWCKICFGANSARRGAAPQCVSKNKNHSQGVVFVFGADYGARTRHLHLGKVALYQMS